MADDSPTYVPPASGHPDSDLLATLWSEVVGEPIDLSSFDSAATCKPDGLPIPAMTEAPPARYAIIGELGKGGMGVVYRAEQPALRREVALKKIRSDLESGSLAGSFLAEALTTAWLDHPNIVPVHSLEYGEAGELSLAMKIVSGRPWSELLEERSADDLDRQLEILLAVCDAVAFAHSRAVLHLDLKPENVMVGAFGEVLVMDWGLACTLDDDAEVPRARPRSALAGKPCGTPCYMAPELADGRAEDLCPATDVYLLGAILHELVTRRPPHAGSSIWQVIVAASLAEPPELPEDCPPELAGIIVRALAREPSARFPRVEDFAQALRDFRTHRQSHRIADEAQQLFKRSRATRLEDADEGLYVDLAEAVAGFAQARRLWEGNPAAQKGEVDARVHYARCALARGDFGLAESQAARVADAASAAQLNLELAAARRKQEAAARAARRTRRGLVVASMLVVVALLGGVFAVRAARERSRQEQRERAQVVARDAAVAFAAARTQLPPPLEELQTLPAAVREQLDRALGHGLDALAAAEALAGLPGSGPSERRAVVATALELAEVAAAARQWSVARSVLAKAQGVGGASTEVSEALAKVEAARTRTAQQREHRVAQILESARNGAMLQDAVGFEQARYELISLAHPRTREQLCSALESVTVALQDATARTLAQAVPEASRPQLQEALMARSQLSPGDTLSSAQSAAITSAQSAFMIERLRHAGAQRKVKAHELLATEQEREVGGAALQLAQLCAEVLGRFPEDAGTLRELWRHACAEESELRAVAPAIALVVSGGAAGEALLHTLRLPYGAGGLLDRRLEPYLQRAGLAPTLQSESAEGLYLRAEERVTRRDHPGARDDLKRVLELDPSHDWAWHMLAKISYLEGELARALTEVDRSVALGDYSTLHHGLRALILRGLDRPDEALEAFGESLARDPFSFATFTDRGMLRADLGDTEGALADADAALAIESNYAAPWALRCRVLRDLGRLEEALEDGARAIEREPKLFLGYQERAQTRRLLGDLAGALEDAEQAVRLGGQYPECWRVRAEVKEQLQDYRGAEADFRMALEIFPGDVKTRVLLANLVVPVDAQAALQLYDEAEAFGPNDPSVFVNRGSHKQRLGDFEGAAADFERALQLAPELPEAWAGLGSLKLAQKSPAEAEELLNQAIALADEPAKFLVLRGRARLAQRNGVGAVDDYFTALQAHPQDHQAAFGLGHALAATGNPDEALAAWSHAYEIAPGVAPLRARADLLKKLRRDDHGYEDLTRALELEPDNIDLWARRALSLQSLGRLEDAAAEGQQMVERFPGRPEAYLIRGMMRKELGQKDGARDDFETLLELDPQHRYAPTARKSLEELSGE